MDENLISLNNLIDVYLVENISDDDRIYIIKNKIRKLTVLQQQIFLHYVEFQSLRKTAKVFNCSQTTIANILKQIKRQII